MNSTPPKRVALFGGSFNPPHISHVLAVTYVLSAEPVDEVWIEPVAHHPLDKTLVSFAHRLAMCERAFAWLGPRIQIRQDEVELGGEGRTIDLLEHLHITQPQTTFRLIMGTDQWANRHRWRDFARVLALAPPIVLGRPGYPASPEQPAHVSLPSISSTEARAALQSTRDPRGLLPLSVLTYVQAHELYREKR